jgi:hypothetical protein
MENTMPRIQATHPTTDSDSSNVIRLHSLEYELLDDIEAMTDEEIDNYVCQLRQIGHEAFKMAA